MSHGNDSPDDYAYPVRDNTRRYVHNLLRENERLNEITISLEGERCFVAS